MVCSHCNCAGHNKTTCKFLIAISPAEKRVAAELGAMLPPVKAKKVSKPLEGLAGSMNIFKEPKVVKAKKVSKPLEGLAGSMNIFKEPKVVKVKKVSKPLEGLAGSMNIFKEPKVVKEKKVSKPLEGLAGSMNIFKEPKVVKVKKHLKTCSGCGAKGHNARTCINICLPCPAPTSYCFSGLTAKQAVNLAHIMDCSPAY
jgi:hypothetical protein